jgi:hypothetical protein
MNKQQLQEKYYAELNESLRKKIVDYALGGYRATRRGAGAAVRATGRGIGAAGRFAGGPGLDFLGKGISTLSPLAGPALAFMGIDAISDFANNLIAASARGGGEGQNTPKKMDADVARSLASGDNEDYNDYLADLTNSGAGVNQRYTAIGKTRALAANMAKDRANAIRDFALSANNKTKEGTDYLAAKAEYDKAMADRSDTTDAAVAKRRKATTDWQNARRAALAKEYTIGDIEGTPKEEEKEANGTPELLRRESVFKYYNLLKEVEEKPDPVEVREAQDQQKERQKAKDAEDAAKAKTEAEETTKAEKEAEAKAKAEAEAAAKAEKEAAALEAKQRAETKVGSFYSAAKTRDSLTSGSLNLATYDKNYSGFGVGRGVGGRPIITGGSYVNPNSPEGRIEASIAAGNEPDLPRDSSGRIITNARGVQNPDSVGYAAGNAAFNKSLGFNSTGMSRQEILNKLIAAEKQKTSALKSQMEKEIPDTRLEADKRVNARIQNVRDIYGDEAADELLKKTAANQVSAKQAMLNNDNVPEMLKTIAQPTRLISNLKKSASKSTVKESKQTNKLKTLIEHEQSTVIPPVLRTIINLARNKNRTPQSDSIRNGTTTTPQEENGGENPRQFSGPFVGGLKTFPTNEPIFDMIVSKSGAKKVARSPLTPQEIEDRKKDDLQNDKIRDYFTKLGGLDKGKLGPKSNINPSMNGRTIY